MVDCESEPVCAVPAREAEPRQSGETVGASTMSRRTSTWATVDTRRSAAGAVTVLMWTTAVAPPPCWATDVVGVPVRPEPGAPEAAPAGAGWADACCRPGRPVHVPRFRAPR